MLNFQFSTFFFQIVNFLILLAVLTWFFYRPLRKTMAERESKVNARLQAAEQQAEQARVEQVQLAQARQQLQIEAAALLAAARQTAGEERERLLEQTRLETDRLKQESDLRIRAQEQAIAGQMEARLREAAVQVAGSLIRTAAGPQVHETLMQALLKQGIAFPAPRVQNGADAPNQVQLAYPANAALQAQLSKLIAHALGQEEEDPSVVFMVEPALLAGARIVCGTVSMELSLRQSLERLSRAPNPAPGVTTGG